MESNAIESGNDVEYMAQEASCFPFRNALRMTMLTRGPGPEERFQGAEKKVLFLLPFPTHARQGPNSRTHDQPIHPGPRKPCQFARDRWCQIRGKVLAICSTA